MSPPPQAKAQVVETTMQLGEAEDDYHPHSNKNKRDQPESPPSKDHFPNNINQQHPLPFIQLLSYADALDWIMMLLGTLGSTIHGLAQPIGYLLLGKAINAYGNNIGDTDAMVKALKQVLLPTKHALNTP